MRGDSLKKNQEQTMAALRRSPSLGRGTRSTTVTATDGLTCEIEDEGYRLVADLAPSLGGAGKGPDSGTFGRAALGSCLAMSYLLWAARLDIPIDHVEVVVESDYDMRGRFGLDPDLSPGWKKLRYTAYIDSPAPPEKLQELFEVADRHSPLLDDFVRGLPVEGKLTLGRRPAPARVIQEPVS